MKLSAALPRQSCSPSLSPLPCPHGWGGEKYKVSLFIESELWTYSKGMQASFLVPGSHYSLVAAGSFFILFIQSVFTQLNEKS